LEYCIRKVARALFREVALPKPRLLLVLLLPLIIATTGAQRSAAALTIDETRHLLGRTAFGAGPQDFKIFEPMNRTEAVRYLIGNVRRIALTPSPAWASDSAPMYLPSRTKEERKMGPRRRTKEEREARRTLRRSRSRDLKVWWLTEMLYTPSPFSERMTLFWHNHFTSSLRKVKRARLLLRQNHMLRRHALGNFATLLNVMARDPAMVVYLDSRRNKLGRPNENFARELLEVFTLGEGHYTELDVKEAARAFTGWSIKRHSGDFSFRTRKHDFGLKHFMGSTGRFGGEEILNILLEDPRTSHFVVKKLWRAFVSDSDEPAEMRRLAADFRGSGYDISALMMSILTTEAFWAPENRGRLVKAPTDLVIGTLRFFDVRPTNIFRTVRLIRALGQDLFDPPNVKGWTGGVSWMTSNRLLRRVQFLRNVIKGKRLRARQRATRVASSRSVVNLSGTNAMDDSMPEMEDDRRMKMVPLVMVPNRLLRENLETSLVPIAPIQAINDDGGWKDRLRYVVLDPVFQLK